MSARVRTPEVELVKFARLCTGHFVVDPDRASVRSFASHNDIALNFIERGRFRVLMATGFSYELGPGQLTVFWGAVPHKIEAFEPDTLLHAVVLPVGTFLRWSMPSEFNRRLMSGEIFFEPDRREGPHDLRLLNRWHRDIFSNGVEGETIALLELEGRLRRLAQACPSPRQMRRHAARGTASKAEAMLLLIAQHFREHLLPRDVAAAVGLHPDYAGRLFRERMGLALTDYIIECRIAHAKTLLATSDTKMLDVALDSGFGSVGHFHAIFKRQCGCTPHAFRRTFTRGSRAAQSAPDRSRRAQTSSRR